MQIVFPYLPGFRGQLILDTSDQVSGACAASGADFDRGGGDAGGGGETLFKALGGVTDDAGTFGDAFVVSTGAAAATAVST